MKKTLDGWLDVIILLFLMAISAAITVTALDSVSGLEASIGRDKVTVAADHLIYDDVQYTVGDLLLTAIRIDRMSPTDLVTVTYQGKSVEIDMSSEEIIQNVYLGAQRIMSLKPASMDSSDWYKLPVTTVLTIDSSKSAYNYSVKIGG